MKDTNAPATVYARLEECPRKPSEKTESRRGKMPSVSITRDHSSGESSSSSGEAATAMPSMSPGSGTKPRSDPATWSGALP